MAKVCYFFGLSPQQYRNLYVDDESMLWQSIDMIEAQQDLRSLSLERYSMYKHDKDRRELVRNLRKRALPNHMRHSEGSNMSDLAKGIFGG